MYSDRTVLLSVAQKIEQFATSCVWQNFHWNTVKHKLHRVYILFFCDQFKRLDSRLWKGENFLFFIFDLDTSAWHSSCDIVNPATLIIWWMTFGNHRTICTVFRSAAPHLSSSSSLTTSSLALVNTLSRLSGDVMWTSWTISAWRACFPRGAWCDAPSSDEHMLDTHFSADVPHSCMHNIAYKSSTTRYRSFRKRSSEPITLGDSEKTKPNTNKSNNTKTKSSKLMLKNTKH